MQARGKVIGAEAMRESLGGSELHQQPSLALPPLNARAMKSLPRAQSPAAAGFAAGRMGDLFGEVPPSPPRVSNAGQAHGYAASPGTGPKDETCGSCAHLYRKRMAKTYLKCDLMSATWTGGHGSDVLSRSPACLKWESK